MNRSQRRSAPRESASPGTIPPKLTEQMFTEAVSRHQSGQLLQAETLYRAAIALDAVAAQPAYNLGLLQQTQNRMDEAIVSYRHAIAVDPAYHDAYCNMAVAMQELGRFEEAIKVYQTVLALKPDFAMAVCNLGVALRSLGRLEESAAACRRALALQPNYDWAQINLGAVLLDQGDTDGAVHALRRATAINPGMLNGWFNLGSACKAACLLPEAEAALRNAVALQPDFAEAHFTLAQVLLLSGNLAAGWTEYEWRWKLKEYAWLQTMHGVFQQPLWMGEDIADQTILVYCEQGLGDAMQYLRYIPLLVARAGHVVLAVHKPLLALFRDIPGVTLVALDTPTLPAFNTHCPLLSLPHAFATTLDSIPAGIPYLHARKQDEQRWHPRLDATRLRVGIVWAGNPTQVGDRFRSPRLAARQRARLGRRNHRLHRHRGDYVRPGSGDHLLHGALAPRRRHGRSGLGHDPVQPAFPLAARPRRQPLVSVAAILPPGQLRQRLARRGRPDRHRPRRPGRLALKPAWRRRATRPPAAWPRGAATSLPPSTAGRRRG
jgi:tetratricopeptide (TPR) repeat protein